MRALLEFRLRLRHAFALACLLVPSTASAGWIHDTFGYSPIAPSSGDQVLAQMVSDGIDGAYFVFTDKRTGTEELYLQRLTSTGQIAGGWPASGFQVSSNVSKKLQPQMVSDGAGGVIVTWVDFSTGNGDIYAQRVLPNGTLAGGTWPLGGLRLSTSAQVERRPQICTDGAGGALIAYESTFSSTDTDIYGAHVTSSGSVVFDQVLDFGNADARQISVCPDNAGGYYVAYQDSSSAFQGHPHIFATHTTGSGTGISPTKLNNGADQYTDINPRVIPDGNGAFFLVWLRNDTHITFDINLQAYTSSLTLGAGGFEITSFGLDSPVFNAISDGVAGIICSWKEQFGHTKVARLVLFASPWSSYPDLGTSGVGGEAPALSSDGSGGVIVGLDDDPVLIAQRLSAGGGTVAHWGSGAVVQSYVGQRNVMDVTDGGHGAIVGWAQSITGVYQIYAQRVDQFGALGKPEPAITGITDVVGDQGGHVRFAWNGSYLDSDPYYAISSYYIWRQTPLSSAMAATRMGAKWADDGSAEAAAALSGASAVASGASSADATAAGRIFRHSSSGAYAWEFIASQPTDGSSQYTYTAATTRDSTGTSNPRTAFMVEARWSGGTAFWDSPPDSGYSVDNLAPAAPVQFTGQYASGTTQLHWLPNVEPDLARYRLYRGTTSNFAPGPSNQVASPPDTGWVDAAGAAYYYKLSAVDVHGNESLYATLLPQGVAGGPVGSAAPRLALAVVSANPTSAEATLRFDLTRDGPVRLSVYDASGRLVRDVADASFVAGEWFRSWDGHDGLGHEQPSGLYFVRLSAEGRALTRKVVLLR